MNCEEQKEGRLGYMINAKKYKRTSYAQVKRIFNRKRRRVNKLKLMKGEEDFLSYKQYSGTEF